MKGSPQKRETPPGALSKLNNMVKRPGVRRTKTPTKPTTDVDALLDMIDQRVGHLLIRSSEIESKLDGMELNRTKTSKREDKKQNFHLEDSDEPYPYVEKKNKAEEVTEIDIGGPDPILQAIKNLTLQVQLMRSEQSELIERVSRLESLITGEDE